MCSFQATNFTNPVYDSLYPVGSSGEEKKGLLHSDNASVEFRDGHSGGPSHSSTLISLGEGKHPLA